MPTSYSYATASLIVAAALVLLTWLPTVSTPPVGLVTAQAASHVRTVLM